MKLKDAHRQITITYCDTAVFIYENQHWEDRFGQVALFRLDSPAAIERHEKRMNTDANRFVGIYTRTVNPEQFIEDCNFVLGIINEAQDD